MGIFVNLAVSTSITQDEWTSVYEESLKMAYALGLSEAVEANIHGIAVDCLTKTKEREFRSWDRELTMGRSASGDYDWLTFCESNGMDRNINYTVKPDAVDPLFALSRLWATNYRDNPYRNDPHDLWGGKTQGEPQHMSLLAIGCMVEDRLKDRAFVYGDISRGQIKRAVQMANRVLDLPIQVPDCCDAARFFERIEKFTTDERDKLLIMGEYYLGVKNAAYGQFLREHFSQETLVAYWQERFRKLPVNSGGFGISYREYLAQGFDFAKLCRFADLVSEDGKDLTETFVRKIIESELYLPEKDCTDILALNTDDPGTYGIDSLFAQLVFGGMRNPRVDRYISLDEIKRTLKEELGDRCDVDAVIAAALEEKASSEKSDSDKLTERFYQIAEEQ